MWTACLGILTMVAADAAGADGATGRTATLRGEVVDAETGKALPARLYIRSAAGRWFHAKPTWPEALAEYRKALAAYEALLSTAR